MEIKRYEGTCKFSVEKDGTKQYDGAEVFLNAVECVPSSDNVNLRIFGKDVIGVLERFSPMAFPNLPMRKSDCIFECSIDGEGCTLRLHNANVVSRTLYRDGTECVELSIDYAEACSWAIYPPQETEEDLLGKLPVEKLSSDFFNMLGEINKATSLWTVGVPTLCSPSGSLIT